MKNVRIIVIESDFGAGKKGAKLGPAALLKELNSDTLFELPVEVIDTHGLNEESESVWALHSKAVVETINRSVEKIQAALEDEAVPFILSGDHSSGLAAIAAYKEQFPKNRLGVVWIDAHADLHTPFTTPSGNLHGMPLAAALGLGPEKNSRNKPDRVTESVWNDLVKAGKKRMSPKLDPSALVFIDVRDAEAEELEIINRLGIRHFTPNDRKELGIAGVLASALDWLANCDHLLVSFDVDSLDPSVSYGTGTPVTGGMSEDEAVILLNGLLSQPKVFAFEVTEVNPLLDRHHPMEKAAGRILKQVFSKTGFLG